VREVLFNTLPQTNPRQTVSLLTTTGENLHFTPPSEVEEEGEGMDNPIWKLPGKIYAALAERFQKEMGETYESVWKKKSFLHWFNKVFFDLVKTRDNHITPPPPIHHHPPLVLLPGPPDLRCPAGGGLQQGQSALL
jgi:hypothetical protein